MDPKTSKEAASKANFKGVRLAILQILVDSQGLATFEIARKIGKPRDSISPNMKPLERMNLVFRSGITRINPSTHSKSEVWKITQVGKDLTMVILKKFSLKENKIIVKCPTCGQRYK
jgi:predicted transcriptional regulator